MVDDRETTVSKAVVFVLKRAATVQEDEKDESDEDDDKIVADADGWVDVDDVVSSSCEFSSYLSIQSLTSLSSPTPKCPP